MDSNCLPWKSFWNVTTHVKERNADKSGLENTRRLRVEIKSNINHKAF